jgi:serine/threonine protein kinase
VVPEIELITLIDLSNLWGEKPKLAKRMAEQLTNLQHRNLLNITREIQYLDHHMKNGFLQFTSEAPDHISSWKSFCKRPFSLEQTISIFRQLCEGIHHIHESGLIFRDVHPTRIHLYKGTIKFNLVGMPYNFKKLLKNETFSGHLNYSAPEILEHG